MRACCCCCCTSKGLWYVTHVDACMVCAAVYENGELKYGQCWFFVQCGLQVPVRYVVMCLRVWGMSATSMRVAHTWSMCAGHHNIRGDPTAHCALARVLWESVCALNPAQSAWHVTGIGSWEHGARQCSVVSCCQLACSPPSSASVQPAPELRHSDYTSSHPDKGTH